MGTGKDVPVGTVCEGCGALYEPGSDPPRPVTPATLPPPERPGDEPLTHCQDCGAEYPQPGEVDATS